MFHDLKKQQIRECFFQLQAAQGTGSIKFPCSFFIEWKTSNSKNSVTSNNRMKLISGKLNYNQKLQLATNMIYDCKTQTYLKKESIVMVNLVSNSRPNEPKLVGRVVADLGAVANHTQFQQMKSYALEYCSVEATLTFKVTLKTFLPTTLSIKDLQRSQLSEFQPIAIEKHPQRDIKDFKDDTRSQRGQGNSVLSSLRKERSHVKLGQAMTLEDRINRIKSEKAEKQVGKSVKAPDGLNLKIKKQKQQPANIELNKQRQQVQATEVKNKYKSQIQASPQVTSQMRRSKIMQQANQFIVPALSRDIHEFDSGKVSQKSIKNQEKQAKNIMRINIRSEISQNERGSPSSIKKIITSLKSSDQQISFHKDQSQTHIRTELQILKQQNRAIIEQHKAKINQLEQKYHQEIDNLQNKLEENTKTILMQNQDLARQQSANYPQQIQQLQNQIQDKDKQIDQYEQIIHKFQESQSYAQQIITLKEHNQQLTEENQFIKSNLQEKQKNVFDLQHKIEEIKIQMEKKQYFPNKLNQHDANHLDDEINRVNLQLQQTFQKLQTETKNHENTKLQLNQLREWYNDIQQQANKLQTQCSYLQKQLQIEKEKEADYKAKLQQVQEKNNNDNGKLIKQKQHQMEGNISKLNAQIVQLRNQIIGMQEHAKLNNQMIEQERQRQQKLSTELGQTRKELDQLELRYLQIDEQLKIQKQKVEELQTLLNDSDKKHAETAAILQKKQEQVDNHQRKVNDILRRLKEKQQVISKMQRDVEQSESKVKQLQFSSDQYKDKLKLVEGQKNIQSDKSKQLEKQNKQLKAKLQKQNQNHSKEIYKLKQKNQDQTAKKIQLSNLLNQVQLKSNNFEDTKIRELQETIKKYQQKQKSLKQNLNLLEYQTNRISDLIMEKETNEQILNESIAFLKQQNNELQIRIDQLQNQCQLFIERNQGLTAEIQLLNAYNGGQTDSSQITQLNRKLMDKNKQLLDQVGNKNQQIAQLSKNQGQLKGLTVSHQLSNSRTQKQKNELEEKIISLTEENQKIYKQFDKLNQKYQSQLNNSKAKDKFQQFQIKIQQLHTKITEKQLKIQQIQIQYRQQLDKLHETMSQKDFQLQYYSNQINQLNSNIQSLNSEVGEKQFQMHEMNESLKEYDQKIKYLQEKVKQNQMNHQQKEQCKVVTVLDQDSQKIIQQYKLKIDYLQAENERIIEKIQLGDQELQTMTEEINKIKLNSQEELGHISYLESELKSFREREAAYIKQIDDNESFQTQFKNKQHEINTKKDQINKLQYQLTQSQSNVQVLKNKLYKSQEELKALRIQIDQHIDQLTRLRQDLKKNSKDSTPIHRYAHTPDSSKQQIDMNDVLAQISDLLVRRKQQQQLENALRLVIDNNARQAQEFDKWSRDRGVIQEKAKLASKQLQKVKASIMKTASKTITQKTQLTNLLKPTEIIVNEMINLSELLAEMDIELQQQQFDQQHNENHTN